MGTWTHTVGDPPPRPAPQRSILRTNPKQIALSRGNFGVQGSSLLFDLCSGARVSVWFLVGNGGMGYGDYYW